MNELRHSVGETVRLALSVVTAGAGVPGLSPTVTIRRRLDGFWYNGSISAPANPFTSTFASNAMAALDATHLPGVYFYDFLQARDTTGVAEYEVRMQSASGTLAVEDLALYMGPLVAAATGECTVFGTLSDGSGKPIANSVVRATVIPVSTPAVGQGTAIAPPIMATTNEVGYFELTLLQGVHVRLEIQDAGIDTTVLVPSTTSTPFTALL